MYEIQICPLRKLYDIAADADLQDCAALCVSSYSIDRERLSGLGAVTLHYFHDITEERDPHALRPEDAMGIASFIRRLPGGLDTLFVCCDSGESRSSAIAAAILRAKGRDDRHIWENPHYHPNPMVYQRICSAFGLVIPKTEIEELQRVNDMALKQAIESSR